MTPRSRHPSNQQSDRMAGFEIPVVLVAPIKSFAQSDEVVILACTSTVYPVYRENLNSRPDKKDRGAQQRANFRDNNTNFGATNNMEL